MDLADARALFERGKEPDPKFVEAFNHSENRLVYLAEFLREEYLNEENPDPRGAGQFIAWWEAHGGDTSDLMGVFETGTRKYYVRHPKRVIDWLNQNLEEGTWGIRDTGLQSGARHYLLALAKEDETTFAARWA